MHRKSSGEHGEGACVLLSILAILCVSHFQPRMVFLLNASNLQLQLRQVQKLISSPA